MNAQNRPEPMPRPGVSPRPEPWQRPEWLPSAQWPFRLHHRDVLGHRIHYVDVGQGPVLLFVHAGMWAFVWRDVMLNLGRDFRCIALDFPGFGLSEPRDGYRADLRHNAEVLSEFVHQMELRRVTLVLHDLGGLIGLDFARTHPQLIRALVVSQSFGWWPRQRLLRAALVLMGSPVMRAVNVNTNLIPRMTATRFGVGRHLDRHGREVFLGPTRDRRRRRHFHDLMHDAYRSRPTLEAIENALLGSLRDRPLLTVFGERNDPLRFQRRWHELFPSATQVVVPGGNHFPMNDAPESFAAEIRRWWQETVTGPGGQTSTHPGSGPQRG